MLERKQYPLLEFDSNKESIIEPHKLLKPIDISEYCVITFFRDVIDEYLKAGRLISVTSLRCETVDTIVYELEHSGKKVCLVQGFLGAAGSAGLFEEMIALGMKKFIVCGGAGVLRGDIASGHIIIPTSAVRDEGLSYHYLPPSREIEADFKAVEVIEKEFVEKHVPYIKGKTWTTDAFYRETRDKVELRVSEGCLCVEMEASAFMAVAQFRGVTLGQILYGGDDVSGDEWDSRDWQSRSDIRRWLIEMSLDICLKL